MFAIGVRYLNGWSMAASDGARKEQSEWPPHPDRIFMAFAAAWFETGQASDEGAALRWLESLPPPAIAASDAMRRTNVVSYVPVNDARVRRQIPVKAGIDKLKEVGLAVIPEHRSRQPRGFPVAIPHDPTMRLIWHETLSGHGNAIAALATKVTHVGHSASFVQAWLEDESDTQPSWEPTAGFATLRLRVPSAGRLDQLATSFGRDEWIAYHDLSDKIDQAQDDLKERKHPPRVAWRDFPDAILLASEPRTRRHPHYAAAKTGDPGAAANLVNALVDDRGLAAIQALMDQADMAETAFVSAHAYERQGLNCIPGALAKLLSERLGIRFDRKIMQTNVVGHTGADGYGRLARQAAFAGPVEQGRHYVMVDDLVGQGGTLANLRGWVEKRGGTVVGAVGLTGKPYSAKLNPTEEQLDELRQKHGSDFEKWWREHFGHTFDCLTQSEARYLARSPDVDTIRIRLAAAKLGRGSQGHRRSPREQRQHVKNLKAQITARFPKGKPPPPMRPPTGKWHGYGRPRTTVPDATPRSVFGPHMIVLDIRDRRVSLPTTLSLTTALRGLLMRECGVQPPPEWFCGHRPDGKPSVAPHMALVPLPFVGSQHSDGRIVGLALVLPCGMDSVEAGRCLEPILHDAETGLPRPHRLFGGKWFECTVGLDTRECPPINLDSNTWTVPSRVWASVTPLVLNRHFEGDDKWERAAESMQDACEHIGLPRPREVLLHPVSSVEGVPHAKDFPRLVRKRDGGHQSHNHAVIIFDEPVRGPVLIGAGRFRGYGLCRPMDGARERFNNAEA